MQYPAAIISVPGFRMSATVGSPYKNRTLLSQRGETGAGRGYRFTSEVFLKTEKIVPVLTLQSMLEEPSY